MLILFMKRIRLLVLGVLLLSAAGAMAAIVGGVRQKPVPSAMQGFVVSKTVDSYYYLYNVGAAAFFTEGNDWGTQASVGLYGLKVAFTADAEHADTYFFNDYALSQADWRLVFFDSTTQMFVDRASQANYRWGVEQHGNTFRLFASPNGNPGWDEGRWNHIDCYQPGMYVGLDANAEGTELLPYLDDSAGHCIDWTYVSESDYFNYEDQLYVWLVAEDLREAIASAEQRGIDVSAQKALYLDENTSVDNLYAAIEAVNAAISEWENAEALHATAANPYDMTLKIVNPRFDGDDIWTGWSGTEFGQASPKENAEHYNKTYDTYQTIGGLPRGIYAVGVKAFYRAGTSQVSYNSFKSGDESLDYACLYATSGTTTIRQPIVSPFTAQLTEHVWVGAESEVIDNETGQMFVIPNNMVAAEYYMHTLGFYDNRLLVIVDDSGELTIGVRKTKGVDSDWSLFDDFTLLYYGDGEDAHEMFRTEYPMITSLKLQVAKTELIAGETVQVEAVIQPDNAHEKTLAWTSDNTAVASVDGGGLVTAMAPGTAVITAATTDGSGLSQSVTLTVKNGQAETGSFVINEIMASNVDEFVSPAYNLDGWMELYNQTQQPIALAGLYLSDDAGNLRKWRIPATVGTLPAGGFKVIWFDSNDIASQNAPFMLDVDGGTIYVSDASGKLMFSQYYPKSLERVSYARTTDGGQEWGFAVTATPGSTNTGSGFATEQLAAPVVDLPSQLFQGELSVNVTIPAGTTLRYTTDGSLPTLKNGSTSKTGQFKVSQTQSYRFRLFADGMLPSTVTTRSYIYKDRDYYLPVVSVVGENSFLYGADMGVLVKGNGKGRPGNGQSQACNWNMNWERPVNLSYLDADNEMVLNQDVNLEMCGGWSRAWSPHSFKLKGTKEMGGDKNLPYAFFEQKPYIRNRTIQIRNGGNEYNSGRFKDAALGYVLQSSGIDVDVQSYQPVHEFINGKYIGVLNVREPNNKHYAYANYGYDDDEIDLFEMTPDSGYVQKCGTADDFEEIVALSEQAANSETWEELCRRIDMDEYINYMAAEFYLGSTDWPQNNIKGFRLRDGGKWRFVLFDIDFAFNTSNPFNDFMGKEYYLFNELYPAGQERIYAQIKMVTLFKNLLANEQFRRRFVDAFCLMGGSVYEAERAAEVIDRLADRVNPAMQLEGSSVLNKAEDIKNSLTRRLATATNYLRSYSPMKLSSSTVQSASLGSNIDAAQLFINDQQVPTGTFKGNLFAPVRLKAVAPAGYVFLGWAKGNGGNTVTLKEMGTAWSYYDQGSLDGANWTSSSYSTTGWKEGKAPLGFSNKEGVIATTIDYGTDSNNKRPTYYFRSSVSLSQAPQSNDVFMMNYYIDDGLVVYVNGIEAARFNMPSGTVKYSTFASTYADQFPTGTLTLPSKLFKKGNNVIAVEVHNNAANSTDIIFDASVMVQMSISVGATPEVYSAGQEIDLPTGSVTLTALYRELTSQERAEQGIVPVRINEVSASNSCFINEYGKKNDWVELYNTTDEEIDVEGMWLTDNAEKPMKYQITAAGTGANTKIPARGYLLVWCDKLATTSQGLHADFKLGGEGGVLQLMAADRSWTDTFYYGVHGGTQTVGRFPDGCADIYVMNVPTIDKANTLNSYSELTDQEALHNATGIRTAMIAAAGGLRMHYGSQQLFVKNEDGGQMRVGIYTTDGRLIEQTVLSATPKTARVSVAHLPRGFYVARATDAEGNRVACKFMR
jgi:hypothetical protein